MGDPAIPVVDPYDPHSAPAGSATQPVNIPAAAAAVATPEWPDSDANLPPDAPKGVNRYYPGYKDPTRPANHQWVLYRTDNSDDYYAGLVTVTV